MKKLLKWLRPRLRLWAIYRELGFVPWRKPAKARKEKESKGVYIGTREAIPFMNDDAKRTLSHLFMRPGFMMRDYIIRGDHEHYLAPFTAMLVFYSVFTLLVAIVNPQASKSTFATALSEGMKDGSLIIQADSASRPGTQEQISKAMAAVADAVMLTQLDLNPEAADKPWKESLAAIEGDLRSKGIPLFLGNFLLMWLTIARVLRKKKITFSGAAAASAYILCQYCIFMFLALLLSWGKDFDLGVLLMGVLLFIDYRQMLGTSYRESAVLTLKTGLYYLLIVTSFYLLLSIGLIIFAIASI